jgi:hypothetical protein
MIMKNEATLEERRNLRTLSSYTDINESKTKMLLRKRVPIQGTQQ